MSTGKLKLDDVVLVCDLVKGNMSRAAERLAVTRWGLHKFVKRHPRAQEAFAQWRQRLVDEAETALWDCVAEKQPWALALVLKTLGKFRGYIEAKDLTPTGQTHLPQGAEGQTGEDFVTDMRPSRRSWEDDEIEPEPETDADGAKDALEELWRQQEALIARQQAQLEAQAAEIAHLRGQLAAATVQPETPEVDDLAMQAEIQSLMEQVRRKLGQDHLA